MAHFWSKVLLEGVCALNQHPVCSAVPPISEMDRSRSQSVEMRVASLTVTPSNPLAKFSAFYSCNIRLCWSRHPSSIGKNDSNRKQQ